MSGLFVTGTDTGVGKTALSAALLAAMSVAGLAVSAFKPAVTGLDEAPDGGWPADHELLAREAGMTAGEVAPWSFGPAASPHLAAELAGAEIDPGALIARGRELAAGRVLVAEGVGGLLVPLTPSFSVCDLAAALGLPLVVVARSGLGTINHTLLTLAAARARGLEVQAVVLNRWPARPDAIERSNRETIARVGGVAVTTLGELPSPDPEALAAAGRALPWRSWLAGA
ncbi:MAG TPA: dethiobiotin synthase [Solirubrobacteraceae bacterium]|jgi:dethiobiotin synthetase|nr:dethiobiotin synthase [Solirubrobacteraceae bacterium]